MNRIFYNIFRSINKLIFASYRDACHELFCVFGDFYVTGTQLTKWLELATNDKKMGKILTKKLPIFKTRISETQTRDICPNPQPCHAPRGPQEKMVWTFRSNWTNWVLLATYLKYIDCNSLSSLKTTVIHSCSSWSVKQCTTPSSVTMTIICREMPNLSAIVLGYVITYVSLKQHKVKFESRIKLTAS